MNISIVIVNYNALALLDKCLSSIIKHTEGLNFEIIVVDNNSSEGDVEQIADSYHKIKIIKNKKNLGFSAANNVGFNIATGKYILILNNDTIFHENTIKTLFDFAEKLKRDVFIGCKLLNEDGTRQVSLVDFDTLTNSLGENLFIYKLFPRSKIFNRFHLNYREINRPMEVDVVKGAFILCTATALKNLKGFDTRFFFFGEETDLCCRFKNSGGAVFYYPGTSIYHIGGASTDKNLWFKFKNQSIAKIQIYQKHYSGMKAFLLIALHFSGIFLRVPLYFFAGVLSLNQSLIMKSFFYLKTLFVYPTNQFN